MLDVLIKGSTLGLLLAISVGPIVFTVIKQSLNNGLKGGLAFISGIFISDVFLVVCANFFTQFFIALSDFRKPIGIAGSVLLIGVGLYFLFFKKVVVKEGDTISFKFRKRDYARMFFAGSVMNLLNPGIIIFWLTTATAFADHKLGQRIGIFSVALFWALAADVLKVTLADKIRRKLTYKNIHRINQLNGLILIGFGLVLLWGLMVYGETPQH